MKAARSLYDRLVLDHPIAVLVLLAVVLLCLSFSRTDFRLDASADSLLLEDDEDLRTFRQFSERYHEGSALYLAFTPDGDLFGNNAQQLIKQLKKEIELLDGVDSVLSVLDLPLLRQTDRSLAELVTGYRTLQSEDVDMARARQELLASPVFNNLVVSTDGTTTALQINLASDKVFSELTKTKHELLYRKRQAELTESERSTFELINIRYAAAKRELDGRNHRLIGAIRSIIGKHQGHGQLFLGGVPMIADDMITYIRDDLVIFGLGIFVFLVLMLGFIFRRLRWVLLPLMSCAYAGLVMIGLLGLVGWPVTVISSNFISLMLIITMSMNIHLIVRYRQLYVDNPEYGQRELVSQMVRKMFWPCLYTALTTIIAFGSLVFSDIKPVIDFGWMMSMGLVVTFLTSFLVFPSVLVLLERPSQIIPVTRSFQLTTLLAGVTEKHGRRLVWVAVGLALVSALGISRLEVENSFVNYFSDDTEIHQGLRLIDEKLGGTTPLDILIRFPEEPDQGEVVENDDDLRLLLDATEADNEADYWFTPDKIDTVKKIHDYLETVYGVGKVLSVASLIRVGEEINKGPFDAFELAVVYKRMPAELKVDLVDPYISIEDNEARISVRIKDSLKDLQRADLLAQVRKDLSTKLGLPDGDFVITGLLVLYNNMLQSLFQSQIQTLGVVMLGIGLMLLVLFRSFVLAVIGIIPNLLAATSILGLMGLFGIPLDLMTITIASITIGVAVDNSIHYIYRFREEFPRTKSYARTLHTCHASIGRAIFYTAITIIVGFSILILSNFLPTVYFGVLTALAMAVALLASLTLLPKLLMTWKPF
ncbi:MAG: MMPL family transporter [Pseudomonadota bacterium]|nr:MMPL family transporter [Pseudomonadota bacterium]